jgi:hypothetical protein
MTTEYVFNTCPPDKNRIQLYTSCHQITTGYNSTVKQLVAR